MNPTVGQTSTLDPKLKEAYDRVMGTAAMSAPAPAAPLPPDPLKANPIIAEEPKITQKTPEPANAAMVANQTAPSMAAGAEKESKGISPIIFIVGGVIFFASYAVIWLKVFGVI